MASGLDTGIRAWYTFYTVQGRRKQEDPEARDGPISTTVVDTKMPTISGRVPRGTGGMGRGMAPRRASGLSGEAVPYAGRGIPGLHDHDARAIASGLLVDRPSDVVRIDGRDPRGGADAYAPHPDGLPVLVVDIVSLHVRVSRCPIGPSPIDTPSYHAGTPVSTCFRRMAICVPCMAPGIAPRSRMWYTFPTVQRADPESNHGRDRKPVVDTNMHAIPGVRVALGCMGVRICNSGAVFHVEHRPGWLLLLERERPDEFPLRHERRDLGLVVGHFGCLPP